nr:hypothetical protein [Tanacetum cinerariifolium]
MVLESFKIRVVYMFYMHVYISTLKFEELDTTIKTYGISLDLHPQIPDPDLTIEKLPEHVIRIYVEQFEQGGVRNPFSRVFYKLCKQGHWFSFESKTGKRAKKCYKETTLSLKGWKKKLFLVDRRAIPDAMPSRHRDTNVSDEFPISYNEDHADLVVDDSFALPFEDLIKVVMDVPASSSNAGEDAAPSNVTPSTQPNIETATNAPS